jgi:hypothetical protein
MTLVEGFRTFLLDDATIAGMVSDRVYPVEHGLESVEEQADPAIIYALTSESDAMPHLIAERGGHLWNSTWIIESHSAIHEEAHLLSEHVRSRCHGYSGAMGDVTVTKCIQSSRSDGGLNRDANVYIVVTEIELQYRP